MPKVKFTALVKLSDGKIHSGEEDLPENLVEEAKPFIENTVAENNTSATVSSDTVKEEKKDNVVTPKNSKITKKKTSKQK
ncbi:MAG: hypothetical protein LBT91_02695 [Bifidobacteriaceae bacterium]|jgi:hypothetical protein|nr:hypothetical protein [Bifidobacteriaceae bacterium]